MLYIKIDKFRMNRTSLITFLTSYNVYNGYLKIVDNLYWEYHNYMKSIKEML